VVSGWHLPPELVRSWGGPRDALNPWESPIQLLWSVGRPPANVTLGGLVEHILRSQRPPAATGTVFAAGSSPSTLWATALPLTARLCDAIPGHSGGIHRHTGRSTSAPRHKLL
jgi:hypothetical protein